MWWPTVLWTRHTFIIFLLFFVSYKRNCLHCRAVNLIQLRQPGGGMNFSRQREGEKKRFFDVSHVRVQLSKMAEVSGLRSRYHFESNCKSQAVDEGKPPPICSQQRSTVRRPRGRGGEFKFGFRRRERQTLAFPLAGPVCFQSGDPRCPAWSDSGPCVSSQK